MIAKSIPEMFQKDQSIISRINERVKVRGGNATAIRMTGWDKGHTTSQQYV